MRGGLFSPPFSCGRLTLFVVFYYRILTKYVVVDGTIYFGISCNGLMKNAHLRGGK